MEKSEREAIIDLVKREVVPAIGCTEPVAVSLCVAKAAEILGRKPEKIEVGLSANVLKNAMGVGIPGTDMIGLPIAIALGAIAGRAEYGLEVLRDVTKADVAEGRRWIEAGVIDIAHKKDTDEKLYIEVVCRAGDDRSKAVIAGNHTNFIHLSSGGKELRGAGEECADALRGGSEADGGAASQSDSETSPGTADVPLSMRKVWDFAMTAPPEEIAFIRAAGEMNKAAADASLKANYGHCLGKVLGGCDLERRIIGNNTFARILSYTSAACDARMAGAMIPVMTNSGSGNQGISSTLPVVVFAEENGNSEEQLTRALILSSLVVIYIKQSLGRLSALCGCVVATTGSSCGLTYLMGGDYEEVCRAVKNMIATLTGMICDGAKPGCAMKITSGASTAVLSAMMAMEGRCVTAVEGIIDDDVDACIRNLTEIGAHGMDQTDELVLRIMVDKQALR